jgi:hypothetical protein
MGRYYWGDIEGKFWFAVQPSYAADQFGYEGIYNEHEGTLVYHFKEEHALAVRKQLRFLKETLGDYIEKFENFFKANRGYNDDMLKDQIDAKAKYMLPLYADYLLGLKIKKAIKKFGECYFEAEC